MVCVGLRNLGDATRFTGCLISRVGNRATEIATVKHIPETSGGEEASPSCTKFDLKLTLFLTFPSHQSTTEGKALLELEYDSIHR